MAWVYILQGSTGRHYIGSTVNLERRLEEHRRGHTHTTRRLGELTLVAAKEVSTLSEARQIERMLKAKKNPELAIFYLKQLSSSPESFRGWSGVQLSPLAQFPMAWVYILQGSSGRHYIGSTVNLERRLEEHRRGHTHTTRRLGELTPVAAKEVSTLSEARQIERMLKAKKNPQLAIFYLKQL